MSVSGACGLRIEEDRPDRVVFSWDPVDSDGKLSYVLQGIAHPLQCETVLRTDDDRAVVPRDTCRKYVGFRVLCFREAMGDYNPVFERAGEVMPYANPEYGHIGIAFLESYGGRVAMSFRHDGIYDHYCVYDRTDGRNDLILTTDDYILVTDRLVFGNTYFVEGYVFDDGVPVLKAVSGDVAFDSWYSGPDPGQAANGPVLTIVVPVFNTADYLPRCLDSILASDMAGIAIMLVDDGSSDGSRSICDWYASRHGFISVHDSGRAPGSIPNVSDVRNTGIGLVGSEWMALMDSDDTIHPYTYRRLYEAAVGRDAGVAVCSTATRKAFGSHGVVVDAFRDDPDGNVIECDLDEMLLGRDHARRYFCSMCNKIVRTDVMRRVRIPGPWYFPHEYICYEDLAFTPAMYSYAGKLVIVRDTYYTWEKRHRAITNTEADRNKYAVTTRISWDTYIHGWAYASLACNPEARGPVDCFVVSSLLRSYEKCAKAAWGAGIMKDILGVLSFLCREFGFLGNPYIRKDEGLMDFLRLAVREKPVEIRL